MTTTQYLLLCLAMSLLAVNGASSQIAEGNETQITMNASDQDQLAIYGDWIVWTDYRNVTLEDIENTTFNNYFQLDTDIYAYNITTGKNLSLEYESMQNAPDIYGDRIVWEDYGNATLPPENEDLTVEDWLQFNVDVYMHNLSTEETMQITTNGSIQWSPAIYDDLVVWEDARNGNWDIYMYNLSSEEEIQITENKFAQLNPAVCNDTVVWEDNRNGNWDIYMYNVTSGEEIQITMNGSDQLSPAISDGIVVWEDYRNFNMTEDNANLTLQDIAQVNADIYMYNITTAEEFNVTDNNSWQGEPAVHGDRIVWTDLRDKDQVVEDPDNTRQDSIVFDADIYMYNVTSGEEWQVTANESWQNQPDIHDGMIIWTDYRNGNLDIYMYGLSSIIQNTKA
ncbi:hypothetical protein [Methanolobus halotolerans]|uniref:Beta propeller repeat-containing protein n=1 Tax=Methanolobus halotolerans TaxID=2052935 RepID=A0A4E0QBW2_9EURY|nr:hypothetical protein [Methanolobus halotolerans]TGC10674.1 hypothetical protein CUN85_04135 [Methanolobus halotolerans]